MSIGLVTKGVLNYQMYKYTPSDEIIMEVEEDEISGVIEEEINGEVKEC